MALRRMRVVGAVVEAHVLTAIVVVGVSVSVSGCTSAPDWIKPRPWGIDRGVSAGESGGASEVYRQGWKDGCETGLAEFGNSAYKTFYRFKQNMALVDNPEYYAVWKQAEQFCKHYVYKWGNRPESEGAGKLFGLNGSPLCVICDPVDKYHGW